MNPREFIIAKQIEWAKNQKINLIGSQGDQGRKVYTTTVEENLFQPLNTQTKSELLAGDGSELLNKANRPAKIQALHSSSALCINIFDYWRNFTDISSIVWACGLTRHNQQMLGTINFEEKFPIDDKFRYSPNIDVVLHPATEKSVKAYAIECKFTEAYSSREHGGLDKKYLDNSPIWQYLSNIKSLAKAISPDDTQFVHLHAAQLIKHILGLNRKFGHGAYRLLYLWYDTFGEAGCKHHQEVGHFAEVARKDGVKFHAITYQDLIINLAKFRERHEKYIMYLTDRYL
ncbi:MAG: hypothetical protein L3J57_11865 [Desulfuromusa sp.]|nr:hypothetical protein [Desulfuromusa sp.]